MNGKVIKEHWGEMSDNSGAKKELKLIEIIQPIQKYERLKQLKMIDLDENEEEEKIAKIENRVVTQTIEVMNQTEMIKSMIDTYATNSDYNTYVINPMQTMPTIDFPPETTMNLIHDDKFLKPLWYIPPDETRFTRGVPVEYPKLSKAIIMQAMRKSIAGLLRIKGFFECTDSALVMFTDGLDEFMKSLLESVTQVQMHQNEDKTKDLSVTTLERAYFKATNTSLTSLHNYYKNEIVLRNKTEVKEFKDIFQEYDKLMQASQNVQRHHGKLQDHFY